MKKAKIKTRLINLIAILSLIFAAIVVAQSVSHTVDQILPGIFTSGNYTFNNSLFIKDTFGIGTTHPNATLQVNSSNPLGAFAVYNATGKAPLFIINGSTGNIGLNITSPNNTLHVKGDVRIEGSLKLNVINSTCTNGAACDENANAQQIKVTCPAGYIMTGCSPFCLDNAADLDHCGVRDAGLYTCTSDCRDAATGNCEDHILYTWCAKITDIGNN